MALPVIEQDRRRMDWVYPLDRGRVGTDKVPQNEHMARDGIEHQMEALSACKKARTGVGVETRNARVNGVTYMHNEEGTRKRTRVRSFVTEIVA